MLTSSTEFPKVKFKFKIKQDVFSKDNSALL